MVVVNRCGINPAVLAVELGFGAEVDENVELGFGAEVDENGEFGFGAEVDENVVLESQIQYFSVDWVTIVVWPFEVPLTVVDPSDSKYGSNPVDGVVVESSDRRNGINPECGDVVDPERR